MESATRFKKPYLFLFFAIATIPIAPIAPRPPSPSANSPLFAPPRGEALSPKGFWNRLRDSKSLISWFAGGQEPEKRRRDFLRELFGKHPQWGNPDDKRWSSWTGNLWVGTEGVMYTFGHGDTTFAMFPEEKFKDLAPPPESLPRPLPGRFLRGWVQGMKKDGPAPMGCFSTFSGPFTEWYLLANVATLFPERTLEFDPVTCRIINNEQADQKIRPSYREGWKL